RLSASLITHSPTPYSPSPSLSPSFFFTDPPPTEISPLSLHDALPILNCRHRTPRAGQTFTHRSAHRPRLSITGFRLAPVIESLRSEEHTSELQSLTNLVCRLLLEKKKKR